MSAHIHHFEEDGFCACGADKHFSVDMLGFLIPDGKGEAVITRPAPEQTAGPVVLTVNYTLGHSYTETWRKTEGVRCPKCTSLRVWRDCDEPSTCEDPLPLHICLYCGHAFEYEAESDPDNLSAQRLAQLRQKERLADAVDYTHVTKQGE